MHDRSSERETDAAASGSGAQPAEPPEPDRRAACPACGGRLVEDRGKLVCSACHQIAETCCEGVPPQ